MTRIVFTLLAAMALVLAPRLLLDAAIGTVWMILLVPDMAHAAAVLALPVTAGAVVTAVCALLACIYLTVRTGGRPQRWAA